MQISSKLWEHFGDVGMYGLSRETWESDAYNKKTINRFPLHILTWSPTFPRDHNSSVFPLKPSITCYPRGSIFMFLGHMQIYQAWGMDYKVSFQVRMSIYLKIRKRLCYISYALDIGLPPVVWLQYYYTVDTIARNTHILANLHFANSSFSDCKVLMEIPL